MKNLYFFFVIAFTIATVLISQLSGCSNASVCTNIQRVLVFGDSNVDTGNLFKLTAQTSPSKPRWQGRESNGPLAVEYLALALNASLESHAVSGATTGTGNIINLVQPQFSNKFEGIKKSGLTEQVSQFIQHGGALRNSDLIIIWAGSNDLYEVSFQKKNILAQRTTEVGINLERVILFLHEAGAHHMLIVNRTPRDLLGGSNDLTGIELNKEIAKVVKRTSTLLGTDIQLFDAYTTISDMMRNPLNYGFTETVAWCITTPTCVVEKFGSRMIVAEKFTNWDGAHKTTKVHRIMAEKMLLLVSPKNNLCRSIYEQTYSNSP